MTKKLSYKSYKMSYYFLQKSYSDDGLTMIELLVVIVIVGVLAILAYPSFLNHVGKARELEFINAIGTINRSQQVYHMEHGVFADLGSDVATIDALNINFDNRHIDIFNIATNSTSATVAPVNNEYQQDGTRGYSGGIFVSNSNGAYMTIICKSGFITSGIVAPVSVGNCSGNIIIE